MKSKETTHVSEVMLHPETGEELTRSTYPRIISYKNSTKTIDMTGWYTKDGKDAIFTKEDLRTYNKAMKELKAEYEHILSSDQIRQIRKKLNLTQAEAGNLIGGGPRAFQKYESGEVLPSKAASNLLLLLNKEPAMIKELSL